jgi:exodeoxyribonuclease III
MQIYSAFRKPKCRKGQLELPLEGYHQYWNDAVKRDIPEQQFLQKKNLSNVSYGIGLEEHDQEGRVITLEFPDYFLVNVYTPNSKRELERLDYRMVWEDIV